VIKKVSSADGATEDGDFARLFAELRQWQVFKFAATYGVITWLLVQVVATVGPAFDLPAWVLRGVVLLAIVGFLVSMAWLLFRPRSVGREHIAIYLSPRARLIAGVAVLVIAAAAAALSIRSLSAPKVISIAVLPFADLSPAHDKTYFAEGVAEEILSTLSSEKGIKVLGRTSASKIERGADPADVLKKLGVTHLLEGSARTAGDALRVNVRLVDTSDGSSVWEDEYQGRMADVFSVQDHIAKSVVQRLRGTFFARAVRASEITAVDAYQTYLAARALMRERTKPTLEQALKLAQRIVGSDPSFAKGHALLAEVIFHLSDSEVAYGEIPVAKARAMAIPHAHEAVRLAPDKPEGYAALGLVLPRDEGITPLKKAIALDPARAELRVWLGIILNRLGRNDEAATQYFAAAETEPLWPVAINKLTYTLASSGRANEAAAVVRQYCERGGPEAQVYRFLGTIARSKSDLSAAVMADRSAHAKDPNVPYVQASLAVGYAFLGLPDRALAAWPQAEGYIRLHMAGDRNQIRKMAIADPYGAWSDSNSDVAIFVAGAARDWTALARLYGSSPTAYYEVCHEGTKLVSLVALGLRAVGQQHEAQRLLDCAAKRLNLEMSMKFAPPAADPGQLEFRKASLMAASGQPQAIDWLDRAARRGWLGYPYSSHLADWPQFDTLRADPRYAAIQKRIDGVIARERAKVLAIN